MTTLPPVTLWEQLPVVGVLALFLILIGLGARQMFREFVAWQGDQDAKREAEREKQRQWMEAQTRTAEQDRATRDESWRAFFEKMNGTNAASVNHLAAVQATLVERIERLTAAMIEHDDYVRQALPPVDAPQLPPAPHQRRRKQ